MVDIYLDPATNDIALINNTMKITPTIQDNVRQKIWITMNTNRGNWGFNINFGIPYYKNEYNPIQLLGKSSKAAIDAIMKDAILGKEEIEELTSYTSVWDKQNRTFTIEFSAETTSGDIVSGSSVIESMTL